MSAVLEDDLTHLKTADEIHHVVVRSEISSPCVEEEFIESCPVPLMAFHGSSCGNTEGLTTREFRSILSETPPANTIAVDL